MGLQARAGFVGLVTATGVTAAPQGALVKADNVTLRRGGALEVRQSWTQSVALVRAYRAVFWYKGNRYYLADQNLLYGQTEALINPPTYPTPPALTPVRADVFDWLEARGNLYLPSARGVFKLTSAADTQLINTGLGASEAGVSAYQLVNLVPNVLANNSVVTYRLVAKRTDPNGVIIRSRPSGAVTVLNTAGAARTPRLDLFLETTYATQPIDEVEVYRSRTFPSTVQPDDEMQLVATLKASQFSFGTLQWDDKIADAERTTVLYTSPSRGGVENANDRPPGAAVVETYRGHVFYGNTTGPQRFVLNFNYENGDISGLAAGVGDRAVTANWSIGSNLITGVPPADMIGLERGMSIALNGTMTTYYVTNVSGTTVTMSGNATSSGSPGQVTFKDAVSVDGTWITLGTNGVMTANFRTQNGGTKYSIYEITPPAVGYDVTLVIETKQRGVAPMQILATHGGEMSPPVGVYGGTPTASTADTFVHGLAWSEPDEPEHVPPKNFLRVGDGQKPILGLTAMRDSLLIWKEDGLFKLTGSTASAFRLDPFDPTVQCILPGSIRRLRDRVFALTTLGLVSVSDSASEVVSAPISPDLATLAIEPIRAAFATTGLYAPVSVSACVSASADEANGEYWLLIGSSWEARLGGQALVYSMERAGFTTYSFTPGAAGVLGLGQSRVGKPVYLTASAFFEPASAIGAVTARVATHPFVDPGLVGKLWTHAVVGFSQLGESALQLKFTASESQAVGVSVTETLAAATMFANGTRLRCVVPSVMRRAWALGCELIITGTGSPVNGLSIVLEYLGAESRENIANKNEVTATGGT